jgi:hypothetical protein
MAPPATSSWKIQSTKHANGSAIAVVRADAAGPKYFAIWQLPLKEAQNNMHIL